MHRTGLTLMETASLSTVFVAAWPTIFALDLLRYLIAAGSLVVVLALFANRLESRRIQRRRAGRRDRLREFLLSMSTVLIFSLVGFGVFYGSRHGVFMYYDGEVPGPFRFAVEAIVLIVLHDAYFYWMHRLMHTRVLYRHFHRLHHRSRTPTPWAAYAFAPSEALLEVAFLPLAGLFVPAHELAVLLFLTHMIVRNVAGHAGIELFPGWWLRVPGLRSITTTTHHDLHHSGGGYNYGLYFRFWDRLMGTEHPGYADRFRAVASRRQGQREVQADSAREVIGSPDVRPAAARARHLPR